MKKYSVELTREQLEKLGLEVPKFKLSKEFWKGRDTFSIDNQGIIYTNIKQIQNSVRSLMLSIINLPTKEHVEAYKIWANLMMIQHEMNDGEVLDKGYSVHTNIGGISVSSGCVHYGIVFKTVELAKQFLEENREDLERIQIMGF